MYGFYYILQKAIECGNFTLVVAFTQNPQLDINYNFDDHAIGWSIHTPLLVAAYSGKPELVDLFLQQHNVNIDIPNTSLTAFLWAVRKGFLGVMKVFLQHYKLYELVGSPELELKLKRNYSLKSGKASKKA